MSSFSSFSSRRPFREARWSEAVFLWVMEEPRNLWGLSSIVLRASRLPSLAFRKKGTSVTVTDLKSTHLHLEAFNSRPMDINNKFLVFCMVVADHFKVISERKCDHLVVI